MYKERKALYEKLSAARESSVIAYVTGDRRGMEAQIAQDSIDQFGKLVDHYEGAEKITLFLYTLGGEILAGWSLVHLLRQFCDQLEVIIPARCMSTGTLICLGADNIIMTKQATLGPIDPSTNSLLNPQAPGNPGQTIPLSVEEVAGFLAMAKQEAGIKRQEYKTRIFEKLADHVHPMALGKVMRAREQIQELARKLLNIHMDDPSKIDKITRVLCSEAGSHDYAIYRSEARDELGLNIETPSMDLYTIIKDIHLDFRQELQLDSPYKPGIGPSIGHVQQDDLVRVIVESQKNGGYHFKSDIELVTAQNPQTTQPELKKTKHFDRWEFFDQ